MFLRGKPTELSKLELGDHIHAGCLCARSHNTLTSTTPTPIDVPNCKVDCFLSYIRCLIIPFMAMLWLGISGHRSTMGTTASTKTSKVSQPKTPNGMTTASRSAGGQQCTDTKGQTGSFESERKEHLRKKLRSKIRAIAAFRRTVQLSSLQAEEDEDKSNGPSSVTQTSEEISSKDDLTKDLQSGGDYKKDLRSLDLLYHPSQNREELRQFLLKAKKENQECWDDINTEDAAEHYPRKYSLRNRTSGEDKNRTGGWGGTDRVTVDRDRLPPPMPQVICMHYH